MSGKSGLRCTLLILLYCSFVHAFKYGAPDYICKTPFPVHHPFSAQTTPSPFVLTAKISDEENGIVKIRIHSSPNSTADYFTGYFVRLKNIASFLEKSFQTGAFSLDHAKGTVRPCKDEQTTFVTHDTNASKSSIEINWQAPPGFTGEVVFTASIVLRYSLFWVNVDSLPITVSRKPEPVKNVSNQPLNVTLVKMHKECGETKNCLFTPEYCLVNNSCNALLTIKPLNGIFEVEMFSKNSKFVAMGISKDYNMGADAVTECVFEESKYTDKDSDGIVKAYRSWNQPRRKENERLNKSDVELLHGLYENELIYCKIHLKPVFKISTYDFDLSKNWYYITLASGENLRYFRDKKPGVHYHNRFRVSPKGRYYLSAITADPDDEFFYESCGNGTLCYGDPGTCANTKNCRFAGKVRVQDNKFIISLLAHKSMYVALGFTEDQRRGNDHIVACLNNKTEVQAWRSWNVPDVFDNLHMGQTGLKLLYGRLLKDGGLECTVIFDPSVIPSFKLDLDYYLILVGGSTLKTDHVGYHDLARNINNGNINLYANSSREVRDKLFYIGCGETRRCMGYPNGCIDSKSCDYAVSIAPDNVRNIFSFHIIGNKSPAYVTVGLSEDKLMGHALMVECVKLAGSGKAMVFLFYNEVANQTRKKINGKFFMPTYGSFIDEKLECIALFERPRFEIENKTFDLLKDEYFLLLAGLTTDASTNMSDNNKLYVVSSRAQTLRIFKTQRSRVPIKIHAILMIISWLALSGFGIIIARNYKTSEKDAKSALSHWFTWHKYCMGMTAAFTIAGVVVIYFSCGRIILAGPASNHALLGFITTVLVLFQPLIAIFRPQSSTTGIILFNTFHWFIGNFLHVIAIVTIFLAVDLPEARLPQLTYWILAAHVMSYILVRLLLTVVTDMNTHKDNKENEIKKEKNGSVLEESKQLNGYHINSTSPKFKNLVFKCHTGITLAVVVFVVALVLNEYDFHTENIS